MDQYNFTYKQPLQNPLICRLSVALASISINLMTFVYGQIRPCKVIGKIFACAIRNPTND